jgi:adenine-specific DNA-methyltransferase
LKLLEKTHKGKIDVIYIDPPYNTGNTDFAYEDSKIGKDDGYRHSKWLSFMSERLRIAQRLLSDTGVIFISIDDNEVSNLRLLCDQIFGEDNFISQITLLCNPKGRSQDKYFATCHEYLLVYSKRELPKGSFSIEKSSKKIEKEYPLADGKGRYRLLELRNTHREFDRSNRPNLYYPIYVSPEDTKESDVSLQPDPKHSVEVFPIWPDGHDGCWTWGKSLAEQDIHLLVGQKKRGNWKIFRKDYAVSDSGNVAKRKLFTIWNEPEFYTEKGQVEFGKIFLGSSKNDFPQPKAVEYIKNIIRTIESV